jgi:hypothetical protein
MGSRPVFVNYKKAALDSQPQMLKLTNCLPIAEKAGYNRLNLSDFWCLTPFSAIFQLNHGNHS